MKQYKATDLFLFAVILIAFDLIVHFATLNLSDYATIYYFALTVPITLLIMMRWGWPAIFFAAGDAVLQTVLNNPASWQSYLSYILGYSSILLLLIPMHFMGKQRVAGRWYFTALYVLAGWLLGNVVCSIVQAICGVEGGFGAAFLGSISFSVNGVLSLALGMILLLILRRFDGMFEDQIHFLRRLDNERKEMQRSDNFGEAPIELTEETLSILRKRDEDLE